MTDYRKPRVPPPVHIPVSQATVEVAIIDTTSRMRNFAASNFVEPHVQGLDCLDAGSYSFIVKHAPSGNKHDTILFDLGVRKDWENSPESFLASIKASGGEINVEKDVATILRENGQDLNEIGAIIWSHWHFDHTGDPQTFPTSTDLIVGPGFKSQLMPAYPSVKDSHVDEKAWLGRELHEIDFSAEAGGRALRIGRFEAYDFYGDGSFYLLNSPGHAISHISALARTTADPPSFILLGGDIAHHCGEFRPTPYVPMPDFISPSPFKHSTSVCPGRIFTAIHPRKSREEPFFDPCTKDGAWHHAAQEAKDSIDSLIEADAYEHIFPVMAHDASLDDVVDFYPKMANDWMAKGWKDESRWGFLGSFAPDEEDFPSTVDDSQKNCAKAEEYRRDSRTEAQG